MISHTFAVCAYGESPYLENSIRSVVHQSVKSSVIICTSTPNAYIEDLAKKYQLPSYVRKVRVVCRMTGIMLMIRLGRSM